MSILKSLFKKISTKHKNSKFLYYAANFTRQLLPGFLFRARLQKKLTSVAHNDTAYILNRVNYYNKLETISTLSPGKNRLSDFKLKNKFKVYFFDCYEYTRYFDPKLRINFLFGDIIHIPDEPTIVKSRPIAGDNANSVLLKLNKVRHFIFTKDKKDFSKKQDKIVWRGVVRRTHRIQFFENYFTHPLCEIGKINKEGKNDQWLKERMTIDEQLDYKFILCLEGNDVASNLKWVMSSNSVAVMPKPKYESWFMEGTLIPDYHYILIKDDYSDLEDRLTYYQENMAEGQRIISQANQYCDQFKNKNREELISLLVLEKYFLKTGQPLKD